MDYKRISRFLIAISLWVGVAMFGASVSRADELATRKHFVDMYERMAFVNSDRQLVKLKSSKILPINLVCFAENCLELRTHLKAYVSNSWMAIYPLQNYNQDWPISIFLLSEDKFSKNQKFFDDLKLELRTGEHFDKDVSEECVSFSIFKGHEIRKIIIVVGNFSSWKKTVSCVVVQLTRGSGLAFTDTFDKLWSDKGTLTSLDDNNFHSFSLALGRLIALHFQPVTRPGMSQTEFDAAIDKLSLQELTGGL